jgi:hypothetical protein
VLDTVEHLCTRSCPFTHRRSAVRYRPRPPPFLGRLRLIGPPLPGCGIVWGRGRATRVESASAGHAAPAVGPLSAANQSATKADLYAAVDALRADMRVLLDEVRKLIHEADRRVSDAERARGADRGDPDDAW